MDCEDLEEMEAGMMERTTSPCPFCAGTSVRIARFKDHRGVTGARICCNECAATGPSPKGYGPDVVQCWNIRAADDAETVRLKERIDELERRDVFWEEGRGSLVEINDDLIDAIPTDPEGELEMYEVHVIGTAHSLGSRFVVCTPDRYGTGMHEFKSIQEAEAFCQKMRAEKGEGA